MIQQREDLPPVQRYIRTVELANFVNLMILNIYFLYTHRRHCLHHSCQKFNSVAVDESYHKYGIRGLASCNSECKFCQGCSGDAPEMICIARQVWEVHIVAQLLADSAPKVCRPKMLIQLVHAEKGRLAEEALWMLLHVRLQAWLVVICHLGWKLPCCLDSQCWLQMGLDNSRISERSQEYIAG